ncbi:C-GCAxxG-C-C family (seleno)protein [Geomonas azotofigens]|uniref:C-GCAxxG-C-C family (seleno)protein n=1 Tax=Geomonas azotofigens TaxID=2843196 RepID=UPI001C11CE21|nr:C-GCAxxG-C-C family (seleno)protein [Geomonas azotofigens]MBU5613846.1 C-GCAxxG-C-C family protein [Geomonas azotofigens]
MQGREGIFDAEAAQAGAAGTAPGNGSEPGGAAMIEECARATDALFVSGSHHCAEALLTVIRERFAPQAPEAVLGLATGLGGGCGVGCICGALAAAVLALGLVLPDDKPAVGELTLLMHLWFKDTYGAACCRTLQHRESPGCRVSPGAVAGKVAELLLAREQERPL